MNYFVINKGRVLNFFVALPPAVTNEANNSKRHKSKIKDACVQSFGRPFALLLCSAGTDGALSERVNSE